MGKLKRRIQPSDITINIGRGAPVPECPIPGERYCFLDLFCIIMSMLCGAASMKDALEKRRDRCNQSCSLLSL
jgi:hypothetical protein